MMSRITFLIIVLSLLLAGCDSTSAGSDAVNIRIQNSSSYDVNDVVVQFPEQEVSYGDVTSGASTAYEPINKAYRYACVELKVNGETLSIQPIDYVGESLLKVGEYTYQLDVTEIENDEIPYRLSLTFKE